MKILARLLFWKEKMILAIDATGDNLIKMALFRPSTIEVEKIVEGRNKTNNILIEIDRFINKNNAKYKDLRAIVVARDPGSYTKTRIAITIANVVAWSLNIPVFGFRDMTPIDAVKKFYPKLKDQKKFTKIVKPFYS